MKNLIRSRIATILALGLVTTGLAATVGQSNDDRISSEVRARAHRIFEYDRTQEKLPGNQLYALSIAIKFADRESAERIVNQLEARIR